VCVEIANSLHSLLDANKLDLWRRLCLMISVIERDTCVCDVCFLHCVVSANRCRRFTEQELRVLEDATESFRSKFIASFPQNEYSLTVCGRC